VNASTFDLTERTSPMNVPIASPRTVKVRVIVEVEVDRDAYNAEYNEDATVSEIRAHIKSAVVSAAESDFANVDAITVTEWS
jgi:phage/plasmid primase-like uncharacterized protein